MTATDEARPLLLGLGWSPEQPGGLNRYFRDLLAAAGETARAVDAGVLVSRGERREPQPRPTPTQPRLARTVLRMLLAHPGWGVVGALGFLASSLLGAYGAVTGWLWGLVVTALEGGTTPWAEAAALTGSLLLAPLAMALAFRTYPLWWSAVTLRLRLAVLRGQTMQRRLVRTPPGEVVARALDSDRLMIYADRWVDVVNGMAIVLVTAVVGRSLLAGAVIGVVMSATTPWASQPSTDVFARIDEALAHLEAGLPL